MDGIGEWSCRGRDGGGHYFCYHLRRFETLVVPKRMLKVETIIQEKGRIYALTVLLSTGEHSQFMELR